MKLSPKGESDAAKWASVVFKFLALDFVFLTPMTYAIQLQLLGGIIILQTLPPVFLGLITNRLNKWALLAGWAAGMFSGIWLTLVANHFGPLVTSLYPLTSSHASLTYIGVIALAINLAVVLVGSAIAWAVSPRKAAVGR